MKWANLASLPWPALANLLADGNDLLVLPCGATEQHGAPCRSIPTP